MILKSRKSNRKTRAVFVEKVVGGARVNGNGLYGSYVSDGSIAFQLCRHCYAMSMADVTQILQSIETGDSNAANQLLPLVYEELRKLAGAKMAQQPDGQTLQGTALVHEAWLKLVGNENARWKDRQHFFRAAAEAMRCILIDKARMKKREKHGGGMQRVDLTGLDLAANTNLETLLIVNEALERLMKEDSPKAEVVKLRFFIGLTNAETAKVMGISEPTVKRYWTYSRAWLLKEIRAMESGG